LFKVSGFKFDVRRVFLTAKSAKVYAKFAKFMFKALRTLRFY